jgi:hypothetical protein
LLKYAVRREGVGRLIPKNILGWEGLRWREWRFKMLTHVNLECSLHRSWNLHAPHAGRAEHEEGSPPATPSPSVPAHSFAQAQSTPSVRHALACQNDMS